MNESDLDGIIISVGEGGNYDPLPEDVFEVMIEDIKAEKKPNPYHDNKEELSLNVVFNIMEGDHTGRKLFRRMSPHISIQRPSNLYKLVSAIEGKTLDGAFFEDFKLKTLLGKFLRVTVKNVTKGENTYSNIDSFLATKMDTTPGDQTKKKKQTTEEMADEMLEEIK